MEAPMVASQAVAVAAVAVVLREVAQEVSLEEAWGDMEVVAAMEVVRVMEVVATAMGVALGADEVVRVVVAEGPEVGNPRISRSLHSWWCMVHTHGSCSQKGAARTHHTDNRKRIREAW